MAPPDRKPPTRPEGKPWRQAALGGLLMAFGGALFGLGRQPDARKKRTATPLPRDRLRGPGGKAGSKTERSKGSKPEHWPPRSTKDARPSRQQADDVRPESPLPVNAASEKLGYEVRDTRAGTLAIIMVVSVAIIAASITGLFSLIGHYRRVDTRSAPLTPQQLSVIVPPGPHLQGHPLREIDEQRQRELDLLDHYAWTDPTHKRARIPIDRALALVVGKPLDSAPSPAPQP